MTQRPIFRTLSAIALAALLQACSTFGAAGPSTGAVVEADAASYNGAEILVVDLDQAAAQRIAGFEESLSFAQVFGEGAAGGLLIGRGDTVDVTIWEAPPAVLFGAGAVDGGAQDLSLSARQTAIPVQMVGDDGTITIPFVGSVGVAGKAPAEVEREIVSRLTGRAHDPQVVVRLVDNDARNVTVIGEVARSSRIPIGSRGERLLDALAEAGGPAQPVGKTTVQLTRGELSASMPLEKVIRDPQQNVTLRPDDVVTVLHQPYSYIALGAVSQNAEVPFEGDGLSLAQALARIGGLRDDRADIRGVFIFRLEQPEALAPTLAEQARATMDGRVPVIYRLDLSQASSFFAAQDFAIRDEDMIYVSTAPGADIQRFLATISNIALTTVAVSNSL